MKAKKKKILIWSIISFIVLILLLVAGFSIFDNKVEQTSYFYDKNLGIVEYTIKEKHWWNMFQQQFTFDKTTSNVGEQVTGRESFQGIGDDFVYSYAFRIEIAGPGKTFNNPDFVWEIDYRDSPLIPIDDVLDSFAFWPDKIGEWKARSIHHVVRCDTAHGRVTESDCDWTIDFPPSDYPQGIVIESGKNVLNVVDSTPPSCNKVSYWIDWRFDRNTDDTHGSIENREHFEVTSNCEFNKDNIEFRTTCNTGYHVSTGQNGDTLGSGELSCVIDTITTTDCTTNSSLCLSTQSCNPITKICEDYECNAPLTTQCPDNFNITTKDCTNHIFVDTTQNCDTHQLNNTNQTTTTQKTCWSVSNNITCVSSNYTLSTCPTNTFSTQVLCVNTLPKDEGLSIASWVLISIGGLFTVTMIIFILTKFVFKTK